MDDNKLLSMARIIFATTDSENKDVIQMMASALLRSPANYDLNDMNGRADVKRLQEAINNVFIDDVKELEFKKILAVSSALLKGALPIIEADIFLKGDELKVAKDNGIEDSYVKSGTVGDYTYYVTKL